MGCANMASPSLYKRMGCANIVSPSRTQMFMTHTILHLERVLNANVHDPYDVPFTADNQSIIILLSYIEYKTQNDRLYIYMNRTTVKHDGR
jgi:hypothetical protein